MTPEPHPFAALGPEPIRSIGREELQAKLARGDNFYRELVRRGYRNVRRYSGGLLDWENAGLPLEGTMT